MPEKNSLPGSSVEHFSSRWAMLATALGIALGTGRATPAHNSLDYIN